MGRSFEGSFEMPRPQSIVQLHGLRQPQLRRPMPRRVRRQAARFAPSRWSGGPRSVARMPAVSSGVAAVIQPVAARDQSGDADCDVRQVRPLRITALDDAKSQGRRWSSGVGTRDGIFSKRVVPATSLRRPCCPQNAESFQGGSRPRQCTVGAEPRVLLPLPQQPSNLIAVRTRLAIGCSTATHPDPATRRRSSTACRTTYR
jgi:hypothetical protein